MNMDDIFERFVLVSAQTGLAAQGFEVFKADKTTNKQQLFQNCEEPLITPDVVVRRGTGTRFIIDAKYINRLPNADEFYQILAYTLSYGCDIGHSPYRTSALGHPLSTARTTSGSSSTS